MIIKKVKIPIYEQTLYVSITEDYSKDEEEYEYIWRPEREDFSGHTSGLNNQHLIILLCCSSFLLWFLPATHEKESSKSNYCNIWQHIRKPV